MADVSADESVWVGGRNAVSSPFYWTEATGYVAIGSQGGAEAVSADGSVIVGTSGVQSWRWTEGTGTVQLNGLPGSHGTAVDLSADGQIIVGHSEQHDGQGVTAVRWTESEDAAELGNAPSVLHSAANAISADGSTVVGVGLGDINSWYDNTEAFRWTAETGMVLLGDLPGGVSESWAYDVSADGEIVVGRGATGVDVPLRFKAFIWDAQNGMRRVHDVLADVGLANSLAGWTLTEALAISWDGLTIAGNGINPRGQQEAWVAFLDPLTALLPGDYNGNGLVEQQDLDLVLTSWGQGGAANLPPTWTNDLPDGLIDQGELDLVLANWGNTTTMATANIAVPEPTTATLLALALAGIAMLYRKKS